MASPVSGLTGPVAVSSSLGMRTQVPSPWFSPLMKSVEKSVWALAALARPRRKRQPEILIVQDLCTVGSVPSLKLDDDLKIRHSQADLANEVREEVEVKKKYLLSRHAEK